MMIFGNHNLMNMYAAMKACEEIGVKNEDFLQTMTTFKGAAKRLEKVKENNSVAIYKDFAHSPSKLLATIEAMKEQYPKRRLVACMELHTYSSLTQEFLKQYAHTMDKADVAIVYYNHHAIELKRLPELNKDNVYKAFEKEDLKVFTSKEEVLDTLYKINWKDTNLLMMSSGNFDGIDFNKLADELI
jgi:UDP-N-acetylmuramate: L-alanyl-gamma-D-glutamyl-meso-diaminopimelate ligase